MRLRQSINVDRVSTRGVEAPRGIMRDVAPSLFRRRVVVSVACVYMVALFRHGHVHTACSLAALRDNPHKARRSPGSWRTHQL